jgi:aryl-alcohol dehydrogenase-like predicted oxidoreductase
MLAQGEDIVPFPGNECRQYLEENAGALQAQLTMQDLRRIDEVAHSGVASGERYPESMMKLVDR